MPRYNSRAVNDEDRLPPEILLCGRCATACDPDDHFCRQCGMPLSDLGLPALSNGRHLPVAWQPPVPAFVVKGAAFVAAGTLAELLARRLVRRAFGRAGNGGSRTRRPLAVARRDDRLPGDEQLVSETMLFRRVRLRR